MIKMSDDLSSMIFNQTRSLILPSGLHELSVQVDQLSYDKTRNQAVMTSLPFRRVVVNRIQCIVRMLDQYAYRSDLPPTNDRHHHHRGLGIG